MNQAVNRMIQGEAAGILQNRKLKQKDILAWVTARDEANVPDSYRPEEDEVGVLLPGCGIYAVFPKEVDKRGEDS